MLKAVIVSEVKGHQHASWSQASSEASGSSQVLDAGQAGRSVHCQGEVWSSQAERLPPHHPLHQVRRIKFDARME